MTSTTLTWGHSSRLRRATFIPQTTRVPLHRWTTPIVGAALVASSAGVGVLLPLFF